MLGAAGPTPVNSEMACATSSEARVTAAVASFTEDVRAQQIPGLRGLGLVPGRWFLNDTPVKQELPAVYTLSIDWELGVDLRIPAGFARGTP